jgi:predicted dehydrogenase
MNGHGEPRAAIIGAGLMGVWHADAVRRVGGRVTLIIDPDEAALAALGRRHPNAHLARELDAAMVSQTATAAHVCTPLATHAAVIAPLLDAGVHVLAEKPLAEDAGTTSTLLSLARTNQVVLCPVHQFLFQEGVRRLMQWLPGMGVVRRVEFSACSAGAAGEDAASLDGLIGEILPHPLALVNAALRTPLAALAWHVAHPVAGEFRAVATVGGAVIDLAISGHGRPTENQMRVVADGGWATADLFHGYAVRHEPTVSRRAKVAHPFVSSGRHLRGATVNLIRRAARREAAYPGLRSLVQRFYEAIEGGPPPISPESVLDVARTRDRLLAELEQLPG